MRYLLMAAALGAASPALAQASLTGGFAFSYIDADYGGPVAPSSEFNISTAGDLLTAGGNQGPGASNSIRSQTAPWLNRIEIISDATRGFVYGSGQSIFAINQTVTGTPGEIAHISYTFGIDGSFTPGDPAHYLPANVVPPQNLGFYLLAYRGVASGFSDVTDQFGRMLYFDSTAGHNTLSRAEISPGYSNTLIAPFAAAVACFGADTRCTDGGTFADSRTISFDIAVGEDYFIIGALTVLTDGQADFFNTAKLLSINLAPEYGLISGDGGALMRNARGQFFLPGVPEPSSWAMLIAGFGLSGAALRRQRARATV